MLLSIIDIATFSGSCLLDEGDTFLITGSGYSDSGLLNKVSRYNVNGWVSDLGNLIEGRS